MRFPFFSKWRREHSDKPEVETKLAKQQVHETAKESSEKVTELRELLEANHITLRIFHAMGGKRGH